MDSLINYLKDMQAQDKEVVSIQYILDELYDIREDGRKTRYETHRSPFQRRHDESIIQAGWRAVEASRGLRVYED